MLHCSFPLSFVHWIGYYKYNIASFGELFRPFASIITACTPVRLFNSISPFPLLSTRPRNRSTTAFFRWIFVMLGPEQLMWWKIPKPNPTRWRVTLQICVDFFTQRKQKTRNNLIYIPKKRNTRIHHYTKFKSLKHCSHYTHVFRTILQ